MFTLTAISLIIQSLPVILQSVGVISPTMEKLIADLGSAVPGLITSLSTKGGTVPDETIATLGALRTEITALQNDTNISPEALELTNTLLASIDGALTEYEAAGKADDPSTLRALPTDL